MAQQLGPHGTASGQLQLQRQEDCKDPLLLQSQGLFLFFFSFHQREDSSLSYWRSVPFSETVFQAVDGHLVLETSSGIAERHASRMPGTRAIKTNSLRKVSVIHPLSWSHVITCVQAIYSTGGIRLLFPLFRQLDVAYQANPNEPPVAADPAALLQRVPSSSFFFCFSFGPTN
jgi:hypothetical protein